MDKKHAIEIVLKLQRKRLSVLGTTNEGEAVGIDAAIERLSAKWEICPQDLEKANTPRRWVFSYGNKHEKEILKQTIFMVMETNTFTRYVEKDRRGRSKRQFVIEATDAQFDEINARFAAYRRDLQRVIDEAVRVFIHANKIYSPVASQRNWHDLTAEEKDELERVSAMARGIQKTSVPTTRKDRLLEA